ncbi:RNA-binding protein 34-like [Diprion similis]|uniref:RNA-binding protein 34-like n=1 Tax=Diprion similis TaxID=362088 RepID=UPI001EF7C51B|nr:RNA-binding protein 34-like [Diprion similis]
MTKAKSMTPKSQTSTPKSDLKGVKNTSIGKNKTPKFKKTPTGKVALINGTPKGKGNQNTENNTPKGKVNTPLNTPKHKGNIKPNTPNNKQASPGNKKKSPVGKLPLQKLSEIEQKIVKITEDDDDDSDNSDEDINEGVEINEDVSDEEADSDSEDDEGSDEDVGINNILGNSLAEDSDDDDSDFDDNGDGEEGEEEEVVNKGVKQFKGLKPSIEQSDDAEEEEEEDSDSEDDEDDSLNDSGPGLKALLGQSLADDDDDEDFTDNDEEEDDDEDISDEEEDEDHTSPIKKQKVVAEEKDDEDEEEDSDDDEEDEDSDDAEDDTETSKLSLLENNSDNDDEEEDDDEEDDDEDLADGKSLDDSGKELTPQEIEARNRRSIYVGNLPKDVVKEQLIKLFKKFGPIEVIRIRGGIGKDGKTSKKLSIIKRDQLHPVVSSLHAYIRYHAEDAAKKALSMNGHKFNEFFLRVDLVSGDGPKPDQKKAVFLGNLPFKIDDNSIWSHFEDCGKILSVRIVRDKKTKIGKGFGYINFENSDSVALALKLNGTTLLNREIRVNTCTDKPSSQKKQGPLSQKRPHSKPNQGTSPKRRKDNSNDPIALATHNSQNAQQRKETKQQKRSQGEQQRQKGNEQPGSKSGNGFQGQKADKKKKQKFNKFDKKKKQIAAKFAAKPK